MQIEIPGTPIAGEDSRENDWVSRIESACNVESITLHFHVEPDCKVDLDHLVRPAMRGLKRAGFYSDGWRVRVNFPIHRNPPFYEYQRSVNGVRHRSEAPSGTRVASDTPTHDNNVNYKLLRICNVLKCLHSLIRSTRIPGHPQLNSQSELAR
jgi:hypothetical protein